MSVAVLGGGAFGTGLAIALGRRGPVTLWARDIAGMTGGENSRRLPGHAFPPTLTVTDSLRDAAAAQTLLIAVPMQQLRGFLEAHGSAFDGRTLVACCKGIELATGKGPVGVIEACLPAARAAILTGPSFAADIARGLPTALTLAVREGGADLQAALTTPTLRLYRTSDTRGAEIGGALKNVIAIACGAAIGAGLGESARAALMTRGFAEMQRLAMARGARAETLAGLSGFGDLTLTCTSEGSRNYRFGLSLGRGEAFDAATTVEGAATARAVAALGADMPITDAVADVLGKRLDVAEAMQRLLERPLKEE